MTDPMPATSTSLDVLVIVASNGANLLLADRIATLHALRVRSPRSLNPHRFNRCICQVTSVPTGLQSR